MRVLKLTGLVVFVGVVFLTFVGSNQLISDKSKDAADPSKLRNIDSASNADVPLEAAAEDTDATVNGEPAAIDESIHDTGTTPRSRAKTFRKNGSEFEVWRDHKGGKWLVETKWDGEKWVTKRVYYPGKKE